MTSDIEIAQNTKIRPITAVAQSAGFAADEVEPYGIYKAKIRLEALQRLKGSPDGKLILVTAMTPTPFGEGKTTTTIGLAQALNKLGKRSFVAIREPSLGPCLGLKGGAAGGGYSQVLPMEDINLHLNSDMHMISSSHNFLSSMIDNHLYYGNAKEIDIQKIFWHRVIDLNDRALRKVMVGLVRDPREDGFDITASSEVMAILCLSESISDMKMRLGKILTALTKDGRPITASELKASGAMALLMKDALKPNLVQTVEGIPAFVHGGPFANIAHGCSSLMATKLALKLSDYVVTEAGFGSDLGAEKFFDIKCRIGKLNPSAAVIVASLRALQRHGFDNLQKHVENIAAFGVPACIALNKMPQDQPAELDAIIKQCQKHNIVAFISNVWEKGGEGGLDLAQAVIDLADKGGQFNYLYELNIPLKQKIETIARKMYGAEGVAYNLEAEDDILHLEKLGFGQVPICIAKTPMSLSDDPKLPGRPERFKIVIRQLKISAGAGFVVAYAGNVVTMPGLPEHPAAENMDIDDNGIIKGLF